MTDKLVFVLVIAMVEKIPINTITSMSSINEKPLWNFLLYCNFFLYMAKTKFQPKNTGLNIESKGFSVGRTIQVTIFNFDKISYFASVLHCITPGGIFKWIVVRIFGNLSSGK